MKDFLVPITSALVLGIGVSIMTMKYNEGATIAWRNSIELQISSMKVIMKAVQVNQIELASRGAWMISVDKDIGNVEKRISDIEKSRFTKEDASATTRRLDREIELIWEKLDDEG